MKTYLFKSTLTGAQLRIDAANLALASSAAFAVFGNRAFTWEGVAK